MRDEKESASGKGVLGWVIFFAGFIIALVFGWVVFPNLLFSQKAQPMDFNHVAHQDITCEDCHAFKPDGSSTGIPKVSKCKECHETQMGQTEDERILVEEYIQKDKEIPWNVYSWQPDNVYFSHAPHTAKDVKCVQCHRDVSTERKLPRFYQDRITGYSKSTMKMETCEQCHADKGGSNNCEICHK